MKMIEKKLLNTILSRDARTKTTRASPQRVQQQLCQISRVVAMAQKAKAVRITPARAKWKRLDPSAKIKATDKAVGAKLLYENRAILGVGIVDPSWRWYGGRSWN